jgi:signal transduction histidine kinase
MLCRCPRPRHAPDDRRQSPAGRRAAGASVDTPPIARPPEGVHYLERLRWLFERLTVELVPGPLRLRGDPLRLAQVFANLLDNASKYTPKGGSLRIESMRRPDAVVVTVSDNGIGISATALPCIFELFMRNDLAVATDGRGLGIGLAVVRDVVQGHDGSAVASSAGPDLGSRFVVTLPCGA